MMEIGMAATAGMHDGGKSSKPVFGARGLRKCYGSVEALAGVDIDVFPHEILAIMGDNGAGKSTLVRVLSGLETPDDGYLLRNGEPIAFPGIREANRAGVAAIFQDSAMCPPWMLRIMCLWAKNVWPALSSIKNRWWRTPERY